jgi:malate dehydrogenase (oxaloacetate-decarboxylating)
MDVYEKSEELHLKNKGKISIISKVAVKNAQDLSLAYSPGVGRISSLIAEDKKKVYDYTSKGNMVAVVSDGSAVLGLGNIGPLAALPVMEGKAILFKEFGGVDAVPIVLDTQDDEEIIRIVKAISPTYGGINLEDIAAPRCFKINDALQDLGIPVFHDDQYGTAIVVYAALINASIVTKKKFTDLKV